MRLASQLFRTASLVALAGWSVLIFLPGWSLAEEVALGVGVVLLAVIYLVLLAMALRQKRVPGAPRPGFFTLKGVLALLANPLAAVAAWVHLLAFDLMVGVMIHHEGSAAGMSHVALVPCYLLTMLFGPLGLLLFLVIRWAS